MFEFTRWFWVVFAVMLFMYMDVFAADTTENFDKGSTDLELYIGYDGIDRDRNDDLFTIESVIGYGVAKRFSMTLALSGEFKDSLSERNSGIGIGVFSTLLDSDHFDVDIYLNTGFNAECFFVIPSMEINFDIIPDLKLLGLYFRIEQEFTSEREAETGITFGIYYCICKNHQLLLEYDMTLFNNLEKDEEILNIGGIALGYNATVNEMIEIISQFYYDIPQNDEDHAIGLSIGTIITL